jgi:hypothetical protein
MAKSHRRKSRNNFRKMRRTTKRVVSEGLRLGEKGVAGLYNTLDKGFNLGVKGAKSIIRRSKRRHSRKTRRH